MKFVPLITFIATLLLVVIGYLFRDNIYELKSFGLLGIFLINFFGSATLFLPAPAIASVVAGGAYYPFLPVAIFASVGATLGEMVGFFLGHSGRKILSKRKDGPYLYIKSHFRKLGDVFIFLFALIPNPFFDAIGILAGVFHYAPLRFFLIVLVGRFLRNLLLALVGAGIASA